MDDSGKAVVTEAEPVTQIGVVACARWVQLSESHHRRLFGEEHEGIELGPIGAQYPGATTAWLDQVEVRGPGGSLVARVVGPHRAQTEVRLAARDYARLGLVAPQAGEGDGAIGCTLEGPAGMVVLAAGVVVQRRRLVVSERTARAWTLRKGETVEVQALGERARVFPDVPVEVIESADAPPQLWLESEEAATIEVGPETAAVLRSGVRAAGETGSE